VDLYYAETFLEKYRSNIRGRVLEVKGPEYSERFENGRVEERSVLDSICPHRAIVNDLSEAGDRPDDRFDCLILPQTLHFAHEFRSVLSRAYPVLKPGGVLLCALPALGRPSYAEDRLENEDYLGFTEASARRLFSEFFLLENFEVTSLGNVTAWTAFLYGLGVDELRREQLDYVDPWFPLLVCVRAVKPALDG
jgi:SAM-dependent methyltransferase